MSLERKDVRFKLNADDHSGLCLISDIDSSDIAAWVEALVVAEVKRRIHEASVIVAEAERLGISGNNRESLKNQGC